MHFPQEEIKEIKIRLFRSNAGTIKIRKKKLVKPKKMK
jgi:hypothetical protein